MSQSTCELRPEAEPRLTNMYFEAFFFTSRVVYTIFHHALDGKRKVLPAARERTCTFCQGVMKKLFLHIETSYYRSINRFSFI